MAKKDQTEPEQPEVTTDELPSNELKPLAKKRQSAAGYSVPLRHDDPEETKDKK